MTVPVIFTWEGDVMKPLGRFASLCDKQFVVHENYRLEVVEDRSGESHRHYFATINEAWANLPEVQAGRWATPDMMRKWALCRAGFFEETTYRASSKAEAVRIAGVFGPLFDEIILEGEMVHARKAKSQSYKAMTRKEFQDSKTKVLDELAKLIGVTSEELSKNAGRAA